MSQKENLQKAIAKTGARAGSLLNAARAIALASVPTMSPSQSIAMWGNDDKKGSAGVKKRRKTRKAKRAARRTNRSKK